MDQLLKRVITLCGVLMLLPTTVSVFSGLLGPPVRNLFSEIMPSAPSMISSSISTVVIGLFVIGVAVRLARSARQRDPAWRIREALDRRGRTLPRYHDAETPLHNPPRPRPDHDPPLPF